MWWLKVSLLSPSIPNMVLLSTIGTRKSSKYTSKSWWWLSSLPTSMILVFVRLSDSLYFLHQDATLSDTFCRRRFRISRLKAASQADKSSAYLNSESISRVLGGGNARVLLPVRSLVWTRKKITLKIDTWGTPYSQVVNRRGGRLLIFQNFSDPPKLIRTPHVINFQGKGFWPGRFYY